MDDIIKKLLDGGVSREIVEKLKVGLGNTFETELVTNGLKVAAAKIGIDPTNLPSIDFTNLKEVINSDIATKAGISDILEKVGDITKHEDSFFGKIKAFFTRK